MKHIHAECIKAWADGARIEYLEPADQMWLRIDRPSWRSDRQYRVAKDQLTVQYYHATPSGCICVGTKQQYWNLKLTFDPDGNLIKNEVAEND